MKKIRIILSTMLLTSCLLGVSTPAESFDSHLATRNVKPIGYLRIPANKNVTVHIDFGYDNPPNGKVVGVTISDNT